MSLFDDDFYSTRISRRARVTFQAQKDAAFKRRGMRWTPLKVAMTSSVISAAAVVIVFALFTGFDHSDSTVSAVAGVTKVGLNDNNPLEKTISAAAKVRPAVVSIINEQALPDGAAQGSGDGSGLEQAALGSGFIFEKVKGKAHILTNNHVIADAVAVKAVLSNGDTRDAKIIGKDEITDLAVLEIDDRGINTVASFGESDDLRAGQWVMAIGNPLGLSDSLSMGIVSKTKRIIPVSLSQDGNYDWEQEVIQIDASINQGNSGGPLIDLDGNVVGINSMKIADYGVEGVGFAIPSHEALPIVKSLLEYGKVKRPYLGVYTMDLAQYFAQQSAAGDDSVGSSPDGGGSSDDNGSNGSDAEGKDDGAATEGPRAEAPGTGEDGSLPDMGDDDTIVVPRSDLKLPADVQDGVIVLQAVGPAQEAGLAFNDVIVKLDSQSIASTMDLRQYLYGKKKIGDDIKVTFYRDGQKHTATFKLEEKTED
ncbi:S1C family serine protease [Paenibacillus sacheonensis]|uniref:PDZ domain-containing protein n=1 Tax=Paenibacillus sacheonensis TaxID=742054 RepID=A0A7X5BXR5_9BACL|nr:trypsin-like peptidase domain-containing protein [Paenibacillus sacheonensis]MBM7567903.1 serine protease Do [Paenibacillus sacheonensis]NBC70788.1 PDZ domain-containing protein [Paenibacillus sacheonensis]